MVLNFAEYDPLRRQVKHGKAHLSVSGVKAENGYYEVNFDIVAHEEEDQVGGSLSERLYQSGKGAFRLQNFLEATKVITREDIEEAIAQGVTEIDPDIDTAVGATIFSELGPNTYTNKQGKTITVTRCSNFLAIDDSEAEDFPRNEEFAPKPKPKPGAEKAKKEETVPPEAGDDEECPW